MIQSYVIIYLLTRYNYPWYGEMILKRNYTKIRKLYNCKLTEFYFSVDQTTMQVAKTRFERTGRGKDK